MKIIFISIALTFAFLPQLANAKPAAAQTVQVSFISTEKELNLEPDQNMVYCIKTIKHFAAVQKKRRLSLEEMIHIMKVIIYMFTTEIEGQSKHIEIVLNNKETVKLLYSSHLFDCINQLIQKNDQEEQEENDQVDEDAQENVV